MYKRQKNPLFYVMLSALSICVFLGVWYLCTDVLALVSPKMLPSPVKVVTSFFDKLSNPNPDGGTLLTHAASSLKITLTGYLVAVIIGTPLGIAMAWYDKVDQYVRPIFDLIKPVPGVAWVPLMILMLGIGFASKVTVIFISAIVPVLLNAYSGIKQTKDVHLWVMRTFGASNWQMLIRVGVPTALPYIMTGVRVALGSAWTTIVAAELIASTRGLGFMIQQSRGIYRPDIILVGMLTIGLIGAVLTAILSFVENKIVKGRDVS